MKISQLPKYQVPMDKILPVSDFQGSDAEMMRRLQRETFDYFLNEVDSETGLIADKTSADSPSSIAAIGLGLCTYLVGVERQWISRDDAIQRVLKILRFFTASEQSESPSATGYKGFYYHFLEMKTGRRMWHSELSTMDTALLIAGMLTVGQYFDHDSDEECELRSLVDLLYRRVDWVWALNGKNTLSHGWKPESGFHPYRWDQGFSEALVLYILALGSPTYPIRKAGYTEWSNTFDWREIYTIKYFHAGPLFIHQLSHIWIDFRGIQDDVNRKYGIDYFENSRRATYVHRNYAIQNPKRYAQYGENFWGFTASDGPGKMTLNVNNEERVFHGYIARGVPEGPDDGTVSPWVAVTSLPFAPEIVFNTVRNSIERLVLKKSEFYGLVASFNPTFPNHDENPNGWVSPWKFGLNAAPIILMIENFYTDFIWKLTRGCPYFVRGLKRAGFRDGWLDNSTPMKREP